MVGDAGIKLAFLPKLFSEVRMPFSLLITTCSKKKIEHIEMDNCFSWGGHFKFKNVYVLSCMYGHCNFFTKYPHIPCFNFLSCVILVVETCCTLHRYMNISMFMFI